MTSKRKAGPKRIVSLLPDVAIADFLTHYRLDAADVLAGKPVWKEADAEGKVRKVPLTVERIEALIGARDPVAWARLNLREVRDLVDDDGKVVIPRGSPWILRPAQERLARLDVDFVSESASETGKTRDAALRALRYAAFHDGGKVLIVTHAERTQEEMALAILDQVDRERGIGNRGIAGGLIGKPQRAPFWRYTFRNGATITLTISGGDGGSMLSQHVGLLILDEAQKFRSQQVFNEAWRAIDPGGRVAVYGTPSGNYSSPFYHLCASSRPIDGRDEAKVERGDTPEGDPAPEFVKINISRLDMGYPFVTPRRKASWIAKFGGVESFGYQNNVLGRWSSASHSVWPMETMLRPNLTVNLPHYRIVVGDVNREEQTVRVRAARLSCVVGEAEKMIADRTSALFSADLSSTIASFYPSTDWIAPTLICGVDLGSEADPTEALFVRVTESGRWEDVFRLVLRRAEYYPVQRDVFAALDHASGHVANFGFDAGNAGGSFVQELRERFAKCPICGKDTGFERRSDAYAFGGVQEEVDILTGTLILNPDKSRDGAEVAHKVSNKEAATRHLTRRMQAKLLAIADDGGAGDQNLAAAQLLVNHVYEGTTSRGEMKYRGIDDHAVDARRCVALVIARQIRDGLLSTGITASEAYDVGVVSVPRGGSFREVGDSEDFYESERDSGGDFSRGSSVREGFGDF